MRRVWTGGTGILSPRMDWARSYLQKGCLATRPVLTMTCRHDDFRSGTTIGNVRVDRRTFAEHSFGSPIVIHRYWFGIKPRKQLSTPTFDNRLPLIPSLTQALCSSSCNSRLIRLLTPRHTSYHSVVQAKHTNGNWLSPRISRGVAKQHDVSLLRHADVLISGERASVCKLYFDWIIRIGNLSSASNRFFPKP